MESYNTVVEAINALKEKGFSLDFNLAFDKLICAQNDICLNPTDFEIVEVYRFEGETNPSDEDIVYAIQSKDETLKGVLTSAFGMYAENIHGDLLKKLSFHPKK